MKKILFLLLTAGAFLLNACQKTEDLPATDTVMIKFVNKTGKHIEDMTVSRVKVNTLKKGGSSDYLQYEALGQQYGYALVENVAVIGGKRYYTASACQVFAVRRAPRTGNGLHQATTKFLSISRTSRVATT